jgi:16S rRNA (cytosine967-C5)-methyltransferase
MLEPIEELLVELQERAAASPAARRDLLAELGREQGLKPRQRRRLRVLDAAACENAAVVDAAFELATPNGVARPLRAGIRAMMVRVLAGDLALGEAGRRVPWVDWARVLRVRDELSRDADPVRRIARAAALRPEIAARLWRAYGAEADAVAAGLVGPAPQVLRCNRLRDSRDGLAARLAAEGVRTRPCGSAEDGLEVLGSAQLFATAAFREGGFEIQDEASQLVAALVDPPPGGRVLDVCAGAGGKTLAIAARHPDAAILALDVDGPRLAALRRRARRAGAERIEVRRVGVADWPEEVSAWARSADRILVDAPCSGIGALRRHPELRERLDEAELRRLGRLQRELLGRAAAALRPGARLCYATCSLLPDENEVVVEELLAADPGLVSVPAGLGGERFFRTLPRPGGPDGFFGARFERRC